MQFQPMRLWEARATYRWGREEMDYYCHFDPGTIMALERGSREPTHAEWECIAEQTRFPSLYFGSRYSAPPRCLQEA